MSDIAHTLGRALLSVIFIVSGYGKLTTIAATTAYLTRVGVPSPQVMVYVLALFELIGGLMILVGFKTRWQRSRCSCSRESRFISVTSSGPLRPSST